MLQEWNEIQAAKDAIRIKKVRPASWAAPRVAGMLSPCTCAHWRAAQCRARRKGAGKERSADGAPTSPPLPHTHTHTTPTTSRTPARRAVLVTHGRRQAAEARLRDDAEMSHEMYLKGRQDRHKARVLARRKHTLEKSALLGSLEA